MAELKKVLLFFVGPLVVLTLFSAGRIGRFALHEARYPRVFGASIICTVIVGYAIAILGALEN